MIIEEYIGLLSTAKSMAKDLGEEIDGYVRLHFESEGNYWEVKCYHQRGACAYHRQFDKLEDLMSHLSAMLIGCMLVKGKEV